MFTCESEAPKSVCFIKVFLIDFSHEFLMWASLSTWSAANLYSHTAGKRNLVPLTEDPDSSIRDRASPC